jgi:hypothetical protein
MLKSKAQKPNQAPNRKSKLIVVAGGFWHSYGIWDLAFGFASMYD